MKHSTRSFFGVLLLAAATLSLTVPAAEAGGRGKKRGHREHRAAAYCAPRDTWHASRETRWAGRGDACSEHAAHRFFDGRAYCAGRTADGWWRSSQRCEDDYGRKLVNDPAWLASFNRSCEGGERLGWRDRW